MDYKNILEGTRPFFQGLPQPSLIPTSGHATAAAVAAASLPLVTPNRDSSRDRAEISHHQNHNNHHHHHLLNHHQQQHPHQNQNQQHHSHLHHHHQGIGHIPASNNSSSSNSNNNITGNNNSTALTNNKSNNRGSPTVINSFGSIAGVGGGAGRSGSLDRLGHLHGNHHRSDSPGHHHLNHSTSSLNNNSSSPNASLPLVLPQDGAALIRSKFEEGLGATLSQMYAGGQASAYSSTLNLTRSSNHLSSTPPGLVIPSGGGRQTPNTLISDRDRQTSIIHSTTPKNINSVSNSNSKSANKNSNNTSNVNNMVGVRRESPLDLSVKTVRQSADSSTSSLALEPSAAGGGGGINGTRSLSSSGASTPNLLSNSNNNNNMMMSNSASSIGPSGNSARDNVSSVIAAVANSTTNVGRSRSREKSREKDQQGSRTSTPTNTIRYPSPHHHRQQSPSSSSLHQGPPMHQRVANLNLSIPTPTPPPRTGSGSSVASASGVHNPAGNQQMQQHPSLQMQPQSNHHLLSHYPQSSPGGRLPQAHAVPTQASVAAYHHHQQQHYAGIPSAANMASGASTGSQNPPSSTSAPSTLPHNATPRPTSVIPPYNPPLGAGLASYHQNHHPPNHPTASPYSHHHTAYPQYHPHFPTQTGQSPVGGPPSVHPSYYSNYPHIQPPSTKPPTNPNTSVTPTPSSVAAQPQSIPSPYASSQSKLSHPSYAPPPQNQSHPQQNPQAPTGQPHQASLYYHPSSTYYGPPQAAAPQSQAQSNIRPGAVAPQQQQQHPGYPSHHYGNLPPTSSTAATPYPHYSPISYPTYLPSNQRPVPLQNSSQPPSNYAPGQPASANFQPHPGLRPTTPTGPPPPIPSGAYIAPGQSQYPPSNDKSAPNQQQQSNSHPPQANSLGASPMKPPETPVAVPQPRGPKSGSSRKNVLNMLRTSVETRIQEKQEKEKFQFNHQTWNFHGRKFNTSLPPLNSNTSSNTIGNGSLQAPGNHLGSSSSSLSGYGTGSSNSNTNSTGSTSAVPNSFGRPGFSKYESSSLGGGSEVANTPGNIQPNNNNLLNTSGGSGSGSGGSMTAADYSNLHRIRTKAEKKQLFPNLLSQIEQENSHKEAEKMLQNSHIFSRQDLANNGNFNSASVFDFKEDEDDFGPKILTIPQPPPPSTILPSPGKKPRSPKKMDGTRRNSLPKKGSNSSPSTNNKSESLLNHLVEKNDDKSIPTVFSGENLNAGTIQAMKAVTKGADLDSKEDAFWATCDSFLADLQSNPNSIKSRRGGLWQKLKSKSKPIVTDPNAPPGTATASTLPVNKARGVRIRKNSSEEDSDFEVDEKSEEEEEEEEEDDDTGTNNSEDDSEANSKSGSSNIKLKSRKSKRRRVIQSDEENSGKSVEDDEDDEDDQEGTKSKSSEVPSAEGCKRGQKRASSNITKGKAKAESSDDEVETKKSPAKGKRARSSKRVSSKSKSGGRTKSQNRRRRSTRKRKPVIGARPDISDLDDEDATSRTSIGSVESESEDSEASGSESFLNSGMDSDDSDRSTNSDESEDSDEDSDEDDHSLTSSGSRKRKKTGSGGSAKAKKAKRGKSSGKRKTRKGGKWKKKSHGRSTRSNKSNDVKNKLSSRRTRAGSKNEDDDDDDDDVNFEPKSALLKSRSKGRKRRLPKRNCAPVPGNGKLKDISGESGDGEGGSSGEEWIMRGDLAKKKPRIVFGDGSDFRHGWEEEVIDFKRKLRMPHKLIKVTKPSSMNMSPAISGTQSGASSLQGEKLGLINHATTTSASGAVIASAVSMPVPPTLTPAIPKDEPSPAKSAKENKIPQGPKGAKQRQGEKTPEKVAKEKVAEASPILDKAKPDTPSKKAKGRPPKNSNVNSAPPVLTPEEPIGTPPAKTKKSKLQPVEKPSNKKKGKSTTKALASEKKSDTSESPLDDPTIEKAVERMKAAAASATKKERAAWAAKCAAAADNNNLKVENGSDKLLNNSKKSILQATTGKINSKKGSNNNNSGKSSIGSIPLTPKIEDGLPLLSPMEMNPPASAGTTPSLNNLTNASTITPTETTLTSTLTPTPPVKKGFRRNKFKSGFDYIRKKKKVVTNPDGSPVPPQPKRIKTAIEKNTTVEDIQVEIRGWVLNKGHGETALHRAGRLGYPDVAAYCLEYEICSPNCKDNAGYTPLHETCIKGNLEVAKILLAYGANHSQAAPGGIRPLHEACENGHVELVRLLISYGADPTTTTYGGQSPLELAEAHVAVRLLLDQHINDVNGVRERSWEFPGSGSWAEDPHEIGFDATADPSPADPEPNEFDEFEFESSEIPLPPLYKLKEKSPFYVLLNDVLNYLGLHRDKFLKDHPLTEMVELNSNDFLEEAHCCHLLGEKFNLNSSSDLLTLIKYDERVKKLLNIETCSIK